MAVTWPDRPWTLPLRVELAFGADVTGPESDWVWTDVSRDVLSQQITISRGRSSESSQASPTTVSMDLDNRTGAYTPDNAMSAHYPNVVVGTPCRVSVQAGESSLQLDGTPAATASTPDDPSLDIMGDIDIRVEATVDWYAAGDHILIGKWDAVTNQRSWKINLIGGVVQLWFSPTGVASFFAGAALPALPRRAAIRATLDADNGAGGWTARFYWAPSLDGPWQQFGGDLTVAGTTSIFASTAPLLIAPTSTTVVPNVLPVPGRYHRAEVRSGIDGAVVAAPDFLQLESGTTAFTDTAGRPWSVNGSAQITNWQQRFVGNVSEWAPTWPYGDLSHGDEPGESRVAITASGILRRLGQPSKALDSTLRRRIPSDPNLIAYWPMEEGQAARSQAFSPLDGVQPLTLTGVDWASNSNLGGSSPLPALKSSARLAASVPNTSRQGWQVEFVYYLPALPAAQAEIIRVVLAGSTMRTVAVLASTAGIRIEVRDAEGGVIRFFVNTNASSVAAFAGVWNRLTIYTVNAGAGTTHVVARWRDVTTNIYYYAYTSPPAAMGRISSITGTWGAATDRMALGHLAVFDVPAPTPNPTGAPGSNIFDGADDGFAGETAGKRLVRLCKEEGVPLRMLGLASGTARMGAQRPGKLLDLLAECAEADGGILGEQLDSSGLEYRPMGTLYNQTPAVFDAGRSEIANPFSPVLDDQGIRNSSQVSREGGSSAMAVDEASIASSGLYDEQVTLNVWGDNQLPDIAGWRVHLGTWPGMRYPSLTSDLTVAPQVINQWLGLGIGDRVQVINLPPQHPADAVDVLAQGYSEKFTPTSWSLTLNCSPAGPWTVGVLEDPELSRADTDGSELAVAASTTDTTLSIATMVGRVWVTDPAEFPFDVRLGGEVVTVHSISGATSPQEFHVTRAVNGIAKGHAAGTDVRLAIPTIVAL
ncbi:hypothetical protein [Nocardia sp. NPDC051981]|uniref:hypothetical protein n=1 Tax=Nocardia sp. NPDC051981 TaxID=3155417 RepID=UPI0034431649